MKIHGLKTIQLLALLFSFLNVTAQLPPGTTDHNRPADIHALSFTKKNAIVADAENNLWIGTQRIAPPDINAPGILAKFSQGTWEVFTAENSGLPAYTIYSLFSFQDKLYIGTSEGLAIYDGNWEVITSADGLANNHVIALLVTGSNVYAGTPNGLSVFDGITWTRYDTSNSGICDNRIRVLTQEANGRLWIGTENGLSSFFQGIWTTYNSENSGLNAPVVRSLLLDDDNNLWIGTEGHGGLFKLAGQDIYAYQDLYSLRIGQNTSVLSLAMDSDGNIYTAIRIMGNNVYQFARISKNHVIAFHSLLNSSPLIVNMSGKLWYLNSQSTQRNLYSIDLAQARMYDAVNTIDLNNISAVFTAGGRVAWDEAALYDYADQIGPQHFEIPKGSGKHTIFTQALWIGGLNNDTILNFAGEAFRQASPTHSSGTARDFWPGPVCSGEEFYQQEQERWNRVWKISKTQIDYHINHWSEPGYQMPEVIANWPTHGDTLKGQDWIIAPFTDFNNNGIYEPHLGEYPLIRGDQALYLVFNDHRYENTESGGEILGVEVRTLVYVFDNPADSALHHTIFANYQIINRSELTYDSVYAGFFTDIDIGYRYNDFAGCDTILDAYFGYNAFPVDGSGQPYAYGEHPPAQGVTFLNNSLSGFIIFFPSWIYPWPGNQSRPTNQYEFYNAMKAIWRDGQPMVHGNWGHPNTGGTERTFHIFPDDPSYSSGWHEPGINSYADNREVLGSTYIGTFEPEQMICFDKAFVYGRDYNGDNLTSIKVMKDRIQQIRDFYATHLVSDCSDLQVTAVEELLPPIRQILKCYPNPVHDLLYVEYMPVSRQATVKLINTMGATVKFLQVRSGITMIDVSDLNPGLYILIVEDGGNIGQQKIIVYR